MSIHPTSVISPTALIGANVEIGPFCVIGANVEVLDGVRLVSHVVIDGHTRIGANCSIYPFASLGLPPQDLKYNGEETKLEIGQNTTIREHVTVNPGTVQGSGLTKVGSNCLLMVGAHVAHDCVVGDGVIMANNATLAGHVHVGDHAILGGLCAIHQFVRIGRYAMVGGMSGITRDVPPFSLVSAPDSHLIGANVVGLKRRGFAREEIACIQDVFALLASRGESTLEELLDEIRLKHAQSQCVSEMLSFLSFKSARGVMQCSKA